MIECSRKQAVWGDRNSGLEFYSQNPFFKKVQKLRVIVGVEDVLSAIQLGKVSLNENNNKK